MNTQQNSQVILLSKDRVLNIGRYRDKGFDLILDHMIVAGFCINPNYTRLHEVLPTIDKYYWKPCQLVLAANRCDGKVSGHNVIHQGIHHMVVSRGPEDLSGMSHLVLLGEALASASNLYFCLIYFLKWGVKHPFVRNELKVYQRAYWKHKQAILPDLNRALKDPFGAYRTSVHEIFQLSLLMLDLAHDNSRNEPTYEFSAMIADKMSEMKNWKFNSSYDYHTFILYVLWHCRGKSSQIDKTVSAAVMQALDSSDTMDEFIKKIQNQ